MRAYVLEHYGNPEGSRLMDVPEPTPGPGDILVEVHAAGLNPVDFKFRQGKLRAILRPTYRYLFMHPSGTELAQLAELIEQEKLKVIVDKTYLFSNIAEALAYVESGRAKGKVVVTMG
jgi:NADPH:quinone reductase-like Zn-dependent oxidoreductase